MIRLLLICLHLVLLVAVTVEPVKAEEPSAQRSDEPASPKNIPYGVIDPHIALYTYAGGEKFRYDVSYTGGLKLGEVYISLEQKEQFDDVFVIKTRVSTRNGLFSALYPIEDHYLTEVAGEERLPFYYEVWQKEGFNYRAHRVTRYEQLLGTIIYQLNDNPVQTYNVGNSTQNEFSSFFASRAMPHIPGSSFVVPTFADEKRIEVVVIVKDQEKLKDTIFGTVTTKVVEPIMTFHGLYDKRGDTVIWYTDDKCRVPVQINSKLLIGSLTARLVAYENPACPDYSGAVLKKYRKEKNRFPIF